MGEVTSLFLLIGFGLIFLSHRPLTYFLKNWKNRNLIDYSSRNWAVLMGGLGLALMGAMFVYHRLWGGLLFGIVAGFVFLIHIRLTMRRKHMSALGEIIDVFGLTEVVYAIIFVALCNAEFQHMSRRRLWTVGMSHRENLDQSNRYWYLN